MKSGFTLIEMVVVMGVLSVVGLSVLTIFGRTLQGGSKAQTVEIIKQNGLAILDAIDKTARNAEGIVCPSRNDLCLTNPPCQTLAVRKEDGSYIRYRFATPAPSASPVANGTIKQDSPSPQLLPSTTPPRNETDPEFAIRICDAAIPMPADAVNLTDTNLITGVSLENGSFTKDRSAGFKDQVTIKFDLKPGVSSAQLNQTQAQTFQTTINLR